MTKANVVPLRRPRTIECSKCGATADLGCDHGLEHYATPGDRAKAWLTENPGASNRVIAEAAGVGYGTVQAARSPDRNRSPEKTVGRDGKAYPTRRISTAGTVTQENPLPEDYLIENDPRAPLASAPDPDLLARMIQNWEACLTAFRDATPAQRKAFKTSVKRHSKELIEFIA